MLSTEQAVSVYKTPQIFYNAVLVFDFERRVMPTPAYQRIKSAILANIHAGIWTAGAAIPTEMALAEQFGVSRMTVNRALKELTDERVLERRQGSGTFVAQQKFNHTFIEVRNIAKDIADSQHHYRAEVRLHSVLIGEQLATQHQTLAQAFFGESLANNHALCQVDIVHWSDDTPVQYEERWVNHSLIPDFAKQDFATVNTSDYLIAHVPLKSGEYTIFAKNPPAHVRTALHMQQDEPALLLTRKTYSHGKVVTIVNMWHAGSRYQFGGLL